MTTPTALRLISDQPQPWDDRRWRWWLRDSGLLATLSPAETKLLFFAYALADLASGEFDLPLRWLASRTGYTHRAIADAAARLEQLGLFQHIGASASHQQVRRMCLCVPLMAPSSSLSSPDDGSTPEPASTRRSRDAGATPGISSGTPPMPTRSSPGVRENTLEAGFQNPRSQLLEWKSGATPAPPGPFSPPSHSPLLSPDPPKKESSSSSAHTASSAGERSLFELPEYDAAAAAVLRRWIADPRQAHGLITAHRPTAANVRTIVANAFAWRHAYRTRATDKPLHNVTGFIIAALRAGNWLPDDRLLDLRRRARSRAKAAGRRGTAQTPAASIDHARRQQAEALVAAMSPAELAERRQRVIAGKEEALGKFSIEHPAMRRWLVDQVMQEIAQ